MITIKEMEELIQEMRKRGAKDDSYIKVYNWQSYSSGYEHIEINDIIYDNDY